MEVGATVTMATTLGNFGTVSYPVAGQWSAVLTLPTGATYDETVTVTATAQDAATNTADAVDTFVYRNNFV